MLAVVTLDWPSLRQSILRDRLLALSIKRKNVYLKSSLEILISYLEAKTLRLFATTNELWHNKSYYQSRGTTISLRCVERRQMDVQFPLQQHVVWCLWVMFFSKNPKLLVCIDDFVLQKKRFTTAVVFFWKKQVIRK